MVYPLSVTPSTPSLVCPVSPTSSTGSQSPTLKPLLAKPTLSKVGVTNSSAVDAQKTQNQPQCAATQIPKWAFFTAAGGYACVIGAAILCAFNPLLGGLALGVLAVSALATAVDARRRH